MLLVVFAGEEAKRADLPEAVPFLVDEVAIGKVGEQELEFLVALLVLLLLVEVVDPLRFVVANEVDDSFGVILEAVLMDELEQRLEQQWFPLPPEACNL